MLNSMPTPMTVKTDSWPELAPLRYARKSGAEQRAYWVSQADRIARPVLKKAAAGKLRNAGLSGRLDRPKGVHTSLESMGRILAGLGPWLAASGDGVDKAESELRDDLHGMALAGLAAGTDPEHPDFWNWNQGDQGVVDAAKVAFAIVMTPEFIPSEDKSLRQNLLTCLESTRSITPHHNNWLLFSAMVEAGIDALGGQADGMRIEYALRQLEQWYVGDSFYKDGREFHMDFYNSLVIHPYLALLHEHFREHPSIRPGACDVARQWERAARQAEILERFISPEGTFPAVGRSLGYRVGVLKTLAFVATRERLPDTLRPAQVRCALTAVMERFANEPGLLNEASLLNPGFCGHQPDFPEYYQQDSSAYFFLMPFQILGLAPESEFWAGASEPWTNLKLWSGGTVPTDHALGHHLTKRVHPSRLNSSRNTK